MAPGFTSSCPEVYQGLDHPHMAERDNIGGIPKAQGQSISQGNRNPSRGCWFSPGRGWGLALGLTIFSARLLPPSPCGPKWLLGTQPSRLYPSPREGGEECFPPSLMDISRNSHAGCRPLCCPELKAKVTANGTEAREGGLFSQGAMCPDKNQGFFH